MSTGNKRVSQLIELTSQEVQSNDLLLIIDSTARESKKIKVSEFLFFLEGTGSTSLNAISASYVPGSGVDGYVTYAINTNSASTSLYALLAGLATSASFATTASFALNGGGSGSAPSTSASFLVYTGSPNGTASYAIKANIANNSTTTNFLNYFGGNNGTASYAITTQNVSHATTADTASFFLTGTGSAVDSASHANMADVSNYSLYAGSASYLIFSPDNGTASYAMSAKSFANLIRPYGIFLSNTQSSYKAQLDNVDILWSTLGVAKSPIEVEGTITIPFTASIPTLGTVYLSAIDRHTGFESVLDSSSISFIVSPTMGSYGNYESGSITQTFSLMGQSNFYGSYIIFVSSSNNIQFNSNRRVRFNVSSESDTVNSYANVPIQFNVTPSNAVTLSYSTPVGNFSTGLPALLTTQSLGTQIFTLNAVNQSINEIDYFWLLTSVTASNFSNNPLAVLSGIPNTLTYLSCSNCNLTSFYTFESSSLSTLNCGNNFLTSLPNFPYSMSYLNCSNNSLISLNLPVSLSYLNCANNAITTLPTIPQGLQTIIADSNNITTWPSVAPNSIVSMSFNDNSPFVNVLSLPSQLQYLSFNNCLVNSVPSIPANVKYLSSYSCSLLSTTIENITGDLVANGVLNGTLNIRGNGLLSLLAQSRVMVLQSNGWTVLYDV